MTATRLVLGALLLAVPAVATSQAQVSDIATDATDPSNLADTEPSIAVNPANPQEIAVVSFSENWGPNVMAPVWKSSDGGATWRKVHQIPQPTVPSPIPGQPPIPLTGPRDQKIAFDLAGNIYVAELGTEPFGTAHDFVYRQTGAADAALTPGAAFGDDQPHLDVDRSPVGQTCTGVVHSPWLNFAVARPRSTVSRSTNQGQTLTDVAVGDTSQFPNRTTRVAISRDGHAYIVYKTREGTVAGARLPGSTSDDFENVHFRVARSDDCGQNWNALGTGGVSVHGTSTVQSLFTVNFGVSGANRKVARARSSDAWIAVDPGDGDVWVAYISRDTSGSAQIYAARSTDRGATWTSSRVTDGTHHSGYPEVAVADNGTVGVLYIDFEDTGTATSFRHRFARSFDDGRHWNDQLLQAMDPQPIANANSGFLWGDYEGLTAQGNRFYGVFTGQSTGRTTVQFDPIFFTETADKPPPVLRVVKRVVPPRDPGRFNLEVDGVVRAANVRNGGTTGDLVTTSGVHRVSETAGTNTDLDDYATTFSGDCRGGTVRLADGDIKTCIITNRRLVEDCEDCREERSFCMENAGQPGFPTKAGCARLYAACIRNCHARPCPPGRRCCEPVAGGCLICVPAGRACP